MTTSSHQVVINKVYIFVTYKAIYIWKLLWQKINLDSLFQDVSTLRTYHQHCVPRDDTGYQVFPRVNMRPGKKESQPYYSKRLKQFPWSSSSGKTSLEIQELSDPKQRKLLQFAIRRKRENFHKNVKASGFHWGWNRECRNTAPQKVLNPVYVF